MRSYAIAAVVTGLPPALEVYEDTSEVLGVAWALGALTVFAAMFSVTHGRKGAETGRVAALRDEGLAAGEYTLTDYKVFLPEGRPKSSPEREESPLLLRTTNLGLQHWHEDTLRWSHSWATVHLTVEDELLLIHQEGQLIGRFWVFVPFSTTDEILLAADRLKRHRPRR
ncbi:hypothetical protein [Streptomyces sp. NPDC005573]|uniref:hypothetical protein n=1 Tax=Streptomyces sp. NPDC005573 TaxID=3156890 RepID=UPI00339F5791